METPKAKLERTLGVTVLILLLGGCLPVMRPFVTALLWAVVQIAGKTVRGVVYGVLGTALGGGVSARLSRHCG